MENDQNSDFTEADRGDAGGSGGATTEWSLLYKSDLERYYSLTHFGAKPTPLELGTLLEDLIQFDSENNNRGLSRNGDLFKGGSRNTVPDFVGDMHGVMSDKGYKIVPGANWVEVKAKNKGLYLSSNTYQMKGHIDNLKREVGHYGKIYAGFRPIMTLITTADVRYSLGIAGYALGKEVKFQHIWSEYRINNGNWEFRFSKNASW